MVGSIHPWHTLELLAELRNGGFSGTLYFDTFPDRVDPARECAANVKTVQRMLRLLDRVPLEELRQAQTEQDAVTATRLMQGLLFND
jgi:xylose isomerase